MLCEHSYDSYHEPLAAQCRLLKFPKNQDPRSNNDNGERDNHTRRKRKQERTTKINNQTRRDETTKNERQRTRTRTADQTTNDEAKIKQQVHRAKQQITRSQMLGNVDWAHNLKGSGKLEGKLWLVKENKGRFIGVGVVCWRGRWVEVLHRLTAYMHFGLTHISSDMCSEPSAATVTTVQP